ncbi:hypothetical protein niasHT_024337 [Heterodera trifolii]|uniref:Major facilitator superfamily (MFS) profile domain-containing protein n=1 Tax=Heterodera trifolii TaxID=157864 RepID=A0ABD2JMB0_9BILA
MVAVSPLSAPFSSPPPSSASSSARPSLVPSLSADVPNFFLRSVSWICSIGGFLFGYSASVINGSLMFMERELGLNSFTKGVVTSSIIVGAAIGAPIGGHLADHFGRKRVMISLDLLFIAGVFATTFAPNFWWLIPFRAILGFAAGGHCSVGPVFLAEISTPESRSQNVTLNSLFIVLGELVAFAVCASLGNIFHNIDSIWRWMNLVVVLPAVILLFCHCLFVPESPRWLVGADRMEQAYSTLRRLRRTTVQTEREIHEIGNIAMRKAAQQFDAAADNDETINGLMSILRTKWTRALLLIGLGIATTQQIYGVSMAMYYGTEVLRNIGMDDRVALIANISIGLVSFLSTWLGLLLIDRMGRRRMLMIGQFGAVCSHLAIVVCAQCIPEGPTRAWAILGCLLVFLVFFQASIGPVTWLLLAEIFPLEIRGIGMGLSTLAIWVTNCAEGLLFPMALDQLGYPGTFLLLALLGLFALAFVWRFMPETRRKSLEELEKEFQHGDWQALKKPGEKRRNLRRKVERTLSKIEEEERGERY